MSDEKEKMSEQAAGEEEEERAAKKVKTEPGAISMTPSKVEETLLEVCKEHPQWIPPQDSTSMPPPKEYADHTLDKCAALAGAERKHIGDAVQRLLTKSRLTLLNHPKGGRCLRYVSAEVAQQQVERFGGLSPNELLVYQKIEEARNRGLFQKDLKAKTGITNPNVIRSIIDKLVRRRLIKDFTTVHTGKKKMYILADLEPSADLTGGNWYANGELDMALVEACKHTATRFLMEKRREKEGATIKEIQTYIKNAQIFNVDLSLEEILQLVNTLVYDGKLQQLGNHKVIPAAERKFRVRAEGETMTSHDHFSMVPLCKCPVTQASTPPQPRDCPHMDYWLSL